MRVRLLSCDGEGYAMPAPLSWRIARTGSVPCDEMEVTCAYDAEEDSVYRLYYDFSTPISRLLDHQILAIMPIFMQNQKTKKCTKVHAKPP